MRMETKKAFVRANIIQCSLQCSAGVVILAGGKNKLAKLCPGISDGPWKNAYAQQAMNLHIYPLATWVSLGRVSTSKLNQPLFPGSCVFWVCILFRFTMYIQCIICQSSQFPFDAFHQLPTKSTTVGTVGDLGPFAHKVKHPRISRDLAFTPMIRWLTWTKVVMWWRASAFMVLREHSRIDLDDSWSTCLDSEHVTTHWMCGQFIYKFLKWYATPNGPGGCTPRWILGLMVFQSPFCTGKVYDCFSSFQWWKTFSFKLQVCFPLFSHSGDGWFTCIIFKGWEYQTLWTHQWQPPPVPVLNRGNFSPKYANHPCENWLFLPHVHIQWGLVLRPTMSKTRPPQRPRQPSRCFQATRTKFHRW